MTQPPDELSDTLRELREAADMSQEDAAHRSGIPLASLSRYERGLIVITADRADNLAQLYRAPASVRRRLVKLATNRRAKTTRVVMHRGAVRLQRQIAALEKNASLVRSFQPTMVPGILQTEEYMKAVMSAARSDVGEGVIRYRLQRQALLGVAATVFEIVMTTGALTWCMGSPTLMVEQVERIITASRLDGVRVGVIPERVPTETYVLHGFDIYDDSTAIVGTRAATAYMTDPADVKAHVDLFAELEALAVFGDEARVLLAEVATDYRKDAAR